ncbi:MAG: 6-phospho-beta-glucosidase, partial [Erysipelotrichaceae bacterium]
MRKLKVVVVGGGSSYTPELIEGFLKRYDAFPLDEVVLVDVKAGLQKVKIISQLAKRMIAKQHRVIQVSYTLDLRTALRGASFVITQIRVGQLEARILDEKLCNDHQLIGQETTGAGGMFNALRTIPVLLNIVEEVKQICPDAWMINFANPSGMITEAVLKYSNFDRFIGLCNVPINLHHAIAKLMNLSTQDIRLEIAGLNHFIYVTDVFHQGNSIMPAVLKRYLDENTPITMRNIDGIGWSRALIQGLQALPCPYHH